MSLCSPSVNYKLIYCFNGKERQYHDVALFEHYLIVKVTTTNILYDECRDTLKKNVWNLFSEEKIYMTKLSCKMLNGWAAILQQMANT